MNHRVFPFAAITILTAWSWTLAAERPFVFRDVAAENNFAKATKGFMAHAAAWGDVDGDGKVDAWIGTFADRNDEVYRAGGANGATPNMLLLQRDGQFVPVDNPAIAWKGRATGCVMVDFDNDGWTDLYVSNNGKLGKENLLYRNNRGTLELVTDQAGAALELPETSRGVGVFDFDGNGLLDLLVLASPGRGPSLLFQNQGNFRFKQMKSLPSDLEGLGVAIGDVDNNGLPDFFVGGPDRLFMNQGRGKFREAKELGLSRKFDNESDSHSCGAAFGDFDRDGHMDLLVGTHTKRPWLKPVPLRLYRNLGCTTDKVQFTDVTEKVGLTALPMKAPHVEMRDFDNDGWPDLYTAVMIYKDGKTYPTIFKNLGAKPGDLPRFQETAFVHRPEYPEAEDLRSRGRSAEFYEVLSTSHKLMYFCPGPSTDFDGDGRLDLLLPNWFSTQASQMLKNETPSGSFLDVVVVGADKVNRDGIGSVVRAYPPGEAYVAGGAGFIASEQIACGYGYASGQAPVAHLGLGKLSTCDLVITLPHGQGRIVKRGVKANSRVRIEASAASVKDSDAALEWPPKIVGAKNGTITLSTKQFLEVPEEVAATREDQGVAPFVVAKTPPTIDLAFHGDLGSEPVTRRLWSSWGDICVAQDGSVYVGIGDHGHDAAGDGRCFIYRWDTARKSLTQIVDMNKVVPHRPGQPAWTKVHAKIDEGTDGNIYFACTLNAGNAAGDPKYQWTEQLPGAQLYQFDPRSQKTSTFMNLPPKRCTATSLYDAPRNIWWCNLEAGGGDALYGIDLSTKKIVYQGKDGEVGFNRNFALANDGSLFFNGTDGAVMHLNPQQGTVEPTKVQFPDSPGMRASTSQSSLGDIYGATQKSTQLFRFRPKDQKLDLLGPTWGTGQYTAVTVLSPDERFVYYLPGAHGQAFRYGTPVVQYDIKTNKRKVLAFLAPAMKELIDYVPGGTYGIKLSKDGSTLFVNFNGHASDEIRAGKMNAIGFGLTSFAAIHIPASER